jgi:hypothetical protein
MQCLSDRESTSPGTDRTRSTDAFQEKTNHDWRGQWRFPQSTEISKTTPTPAQTEFDSKVLASLPTSETTTQHAEQPKWGWRARREERRKRREEAYAAKAEQPEKEEVQKIKEAVDKIWEERKQAATDIQAVANEKVSLSQEQ